jgi:uncharacterized protein with FMN-binding domain
MARKLKKSQIIRHCVQLISFILLPGLYAMTFSELKTVYQMIIKGNFDFFAAFPSLAEFTAIMILTAVIGRWFCGWICGFGAYNDLIYFMSKKIFKVKFKVDEKVDYLLKYTKYLILVFIIIISWTMGSNILESTSPWDVFGQITDISNVVSTLLVGLIFLVLITIGAAFVERFFCRYLCPLGAVFAIISKIGIVKINKPKGDCGKCRACTINCSMGIDLYRVNSIKGSECINCLKCTDICPRSNANINVLGKDLDAKLTGSVAMATFLGVYGLTNFGADALAQSGLITSDNAISSSSSLNAENGSSKQYKDGTYIGAGTGYRGGTTKVSVTVENGKIKNIETLSNGDTPKYYQRAEGTITNEIISKQSTSVDTISGATFSSKGIISAVQNALNQASSSSSTNNDSNNNKTVASNSNVNQENKTSSSTNSSTSAYKDGTYTGSGKGFKGGTTKVSVTVANGKITNIQTLSNQDTPKYFQRVEGTITSSIISKQSTSVDTVSGATYSSKGIISAVENALIQAK